MVLLYVELHALIYAGRGRVHLGQMCSGNYIQDMAKSLHSTNLNSEQHSLAPVTMCNSITALHYTNCMFVYWYI